MPLRAKLNKQDVYAFNYEKDSWNKLKETYKKQELLMPCCNRKAVPKTSKLGTYFFAHAKKDDCLSGIESDEHLSLKNLIAKVALSFGWDVITEKQGETPTGEKWIADVFCLKGNAQLVFEVQWSYQSNNEFKRRQQKYKLSGIRSLWLYKLKSSKQYSIHDIPYEYETPVFAIKFKKSTKELYVPQFDCSVSDFVEGIFNHQLKWSPFFGEELIAKIILSDIEYSCWRCHQNINIILGVSFFNKYNKEIGFIQFDDKGIPELILSSIDNYELASYGVGRIKRYYNRFLNSCINCGSIIKDWLVFGYLRGYRQYGEPSKLNFPVKNGIKIPYIKGEWYFKKKNSEYFF